MSDLQNNEYQGETSLEEMRDDIEDASTALLDEAEISFIVPSVDADICYITSEYKIEEIGGIEVAQQWVAAAQGSESAVILINGEREWLYDARILEEDGVVALLHS